MTDPDRTRRDEDFSAYVAGRYQALTRLAFLLTGNHHTAEDLVQAALARSYLSWDRIRDRQAVDAYVRRVLVNEHNSLWRRAWRHRETSTDALPERPASDLTERDRELWDLIGRLPPKQRTVLVLRYYEDLTEAETAAALGCSVGAVKSSAHRAIAKLRTVFVGPTISPAIEGDPR